MDLAVAKSASKSNEQTIKGVQEKLKLWAAWQLSIKYPGCKSYPKSSAFAHAGEVRGTIEEGSDDHEAIEVERAMINLKKFDKRAYLALVCKYYWGMGNKQAAGYLGYRGEASYKSLRNSAEYFIASELRK